MSNKTNEPNNLNVALLSWCQAHEVNATALSKGMGFTYFHAWRLLTGKSPVTAETLGRFVLAYGPEAAGEIVKLAGLCITSLPYPASAQIVPVITIDDHGSESPELVSVI